MVRCDDEALRIALRTALVPPEVGTFRPWERRHEASWDEDPLLAGDAAALAPAPELPHAVTAASRNAAPIAIRPACRLVMIVLLRAAPGAAVLRPAPA